MKESLATLWRRTINALAIIGALTVLIIIISVIVAINRPRTQLAGQQQKQVIALAPIPTNSPTFTNTSAPTRALTTGSALTPARSTQTPLPTNTPLPTSTRTITNTPLPTSTPTKTNTPTITPLPTDTPHPTSTPVPTKTATATPTFSPEEALKASIATALGRSNRGIERVAKVEVKPESIAIQWSIDDNLTMGMVSGQAHSDVIKILNAVHDSGLKYVFVTLSGTFLMVDKFGKQEEATVVFLMYLQDTVEEINWSDRSFVEYMLRQNIYDIADNKEIHSQFLEQ